ncbi:MAG: adenylosuccinate lyase, partial [Deltaproteobacteria bacterium]|nr:adenylosuccinate lyase [Deltaproteobacteria bacterium]
RVIAPDATILVDFMLHRATNLLDRLIVYPERMAENLRKTGGLIFSQQVLLLLTQKGVSREEAYRIVQRNAMQAWERGGDFKKLLLKDKDLARHISRTELEQTFDLRHHLKHVDTIFKRVFK